MNKFIRVLGIVSILCFSFYYTEKIALFMQQKDPLYETIMTLKENYEVASINAVINDNYIIPGLIGKTVNVEESFRNMKYEGVFLEEELVFNEVYPSVSLKDNKDKIIAGGNPIHKRVYLLTNDAHIITYFEEMGILYSALVTKDTASRHLEYGTKINYDFANYSAVEKQINAEKQPSSFCLIKNNAELCQGKDKWLIKETIKINQSNFPTQYNKVESGDIILIEENTSLSYVKILLEQIRYKGLKVLAIDNLITEK